MVSYGGLLVIPVHTIESSDSEIENEIDGFPTVAEEVHLANVQLITDRLPEIMQDPKYDIDLIQSKMSGKALCADDWLTYLMFR